MVRVFATGPGDLGSIPGRVIPKTIKMVLDTSLLNTQQYKVCIKGKVERSSAFPLGNRVKWKGVAPSPTIRFTSYWKVSLLVALDNSRQHYNFIYTTIKESSYIQSNNFHCLNLVAIFYVCVKVFVLVCHYIGENVYLCANIYVDVARKFIN